MHRLLAAVEAARDEAAHALGYRHPATLRLTAILEEYRR